MTAADNFEISSTHFGLTAPARPKPDVPGRPDLAEARRLVVRIGTWSLAAGSDCCPGQKKDMRDSSFILTETVQHAVCGRALDIAMSKCVRGLGREFERAVLDTTRPGIFTSRSLTSDI